MPKFITRTAPAYWASYFVNGDASGLEDAEQALADAWLAREGVQVVSTVDGTERFTWHYQLYVPDADCRGGDVVDYLCRDIAAERTLRVTRLVRTINARQQYTYCNTPEYRVRVVSARVRKGEFQVRALHDGKWFACDPSSIIES